MRLRHVKNQQLTNLLINLKQNEAQSVRAESTHKGVNQHSKYVTQLQQQLLLLYLCDVFRALINSHVR